MKKDKLFLTVLMLMSILMTTLIYEPPVNRDITSNEIQYDDSNFRELPPSTGEIIDYYVVLDVKRTREMWSEYSWFDEQSGVFFNYTNTITLIMRVHELNITFNSAGRNPVVNLTNTMLYEIVVKREYTQKDIFKLYLKKYKLVRVLTPYEHYVYYFISETLLDIFSFDVDYLVVSFTGGNHHSYTAFVNVLTYKNNFKTYEYSINLDALNSSAYSKFMNFYSVYRPFDYICEVESKNYINEYYGWTYNEDNRVFLNRKYYKIIYNGSAGDYEHTDIQTTFEDYFTTPQPLFNTPLFINGDIVWSYDSYEIRYHSVVIETGYELNFEIYARDTLILNYRLDRWSNTFENAEVVSRTNYFIYNYTRKENWGDWGMWNWLRDGLVLIVNALEFIYCCIAYSITLVINFFYFLLLSLYALINNYLIFYIVLGLMWLMWLITAGVYYLVYYILQGLVILLNNLIPLIFIMFTIINSIIAFVWSCLVYMFYPAGDFWSIYNNMFSSLQLLTTALMTLIVYILIHLPELISVFVFYGAFWCLAQIKKIWIKSKGFENRLRQIENVIDTLEMPVKSVENFIYRIKRLIPLI